MTDIVERLDTLSRCNAHLMDWICECDDCNSDRITACRDAKKEIERLRERLAAVCDERDALLDTPVHPAEGAPNER